MAGTYNREHDCFQCPECGCRRFQVKTDDPHPEKKGGTCIQLICCGCRGTGRIGPVRPQQVSEGVHEEVHEGVHAEVARAPEGGYQPF